MNKRLQLNMRLDLLTSILLETLIENNGGKKSEVVRKAIYAYAVQHLTDEQLQSCINISVDSERI